MSAVILAVILDFLKILFAANFLEISRKHVFTASIRNITKNRVEKKNLGQILSKRYIFHIQTLVCITNFE